MKRCWKVFEYLNTDWKRLEIPVTLKGFVHSETPLTSRPFSDQVCYTSERCCNPGRDVRNGSEGCFSFCFFS